MISLMHLHPRKAVAHGTFENQPSPRLRFNKALTSPVTGVFSIHFEPQLILKMLQRRFRSVWKLLKLEEDQMSCLTEAGLAFENYLEGLEDHSIPQPV